MIPSPDSHITDPWAYQFDPDERDDEPDEPVVEVEALDRWTNEGGRP